jgi:hypothetical protein
MPRRATSRNSLERSFKDQLEDLERQGVVNRQQQAHVLGMSWSAFKRRLQAAGLSGRRRVSLSRWIPWTVAIEHHDDPTGRKIRILAQAADGRDTRHRSRRGATIVWAKMQVEAGMDVTYDRETGWAIVEADPSDWYLRGLLRAAEEYVLNLPSIDVTADDLGKDSN